MNVISFKANTPEANRPDSSKFKKLPGGALSIKDQQTDIILQDPQFISGLAKGVIKGNEGEKEKVTILLTRQGLGLPSQIPVSGEIAENYEKLNEAMKEKPDFKKKMGYKA